MTSAKIRIKIGAIEIEYEGDPAFLSEGLPNLLETVSSLSSQPDILQTLAAPDQPESNSSDETPSVFMGQLSGNSVAARLGVQSGSDIIICALATLELFEGKGGVTKKEIQSEMKKATSYFNQGHINNFGKNLDSLIKAKKVNQLSTDNYALTASEKKRVEAKIAESE